MFVDQLLNTADLNYVGIGINTIIRSRFSKRFDESLSFIFPNALLR